MFVFKGKTVTFEDGHSEDFDLIVLCTGYKHTFPFLQDDLQLKVPNLYYCPGLYKGVLFDSNPRISYISAQNTAYSFTLSLAQVKY